MSGSFEEFGAGVKRQAGIVSGDMAKLEGE
jgi:hypothetical protein